MGNSKMKARRQAQRKTRAQLLWLLSGVGGLLLLGSAFLLMRGSPNPEPKAAIQVEDASALRVDKQKIDLGDVKLGQTVQVEFTLTNVGDQSLRFSQAPYVEVVQGC